MAVNTLSVCHQNLEKVSGLNEVWCKKLNTNITKGVKFLVSQLCNKENNIQVPQNQSFYVIVIVAQLNKCNCTTSA